jgi:hypothetical protein
MTAHPRIYLESVLNAAQVERAAKRMLDERRATGQEPEQKYLKTIETKDQSGRTITTFEGSPSVWMSDFAAPPRRVVGIKTRFK